MKHRVQQEWMVVLERIDYSTDLATIIFSRYGQYFEWISERRTVEAMEPYVGKYILLQIECWYECSWTPLEEV
jgi:hypothetical protein